MPTPPTGEVQVVAKKAAGKLKRKSADGEAPKGKPALGAKKADKGDGKKGTKGAKGGASKGKKKAEASCAYIVGRTVLKHGIHLSLFL